MLYFDTSHLCARIFIYFIFPFFLVVLVYTASFFVFSLCFFLLKNSFFGTVSRVFHKRHRYIYRATIGSPIGSSQHGKTQGVPVNHVFATWEGRLGVTRVAFYFLFLVRFLSFYYSLFFVCFCLIHNPDLHTDTKTQTHTHIHRQMKTT